MNKTNYRPRYIVLTDIFYGFEVDDIQSLIRLLLYSNEIDIEGIITCTSTFVKEDADKHTKTVFDVIDAYEKVYPNLLYHSSSYPSPEKLRSTVKSGIPIFGRRKGRGFADKRYRDNEGVRHLISVVDGSDEPTYIGLWGGANTLAQAIWVAEQEKDRADFDAFLRKLRIHAISDQDYSGKWIRDNYGDRLFYIVAPSSGFWFGNWTYYRATWPGMSGDHFHHGSEDGSKTKGFTGARSDLIDNEWVRNYVKDKGPLGECYPYTAYILEGDTPAFLWVIPNGLNVPEHPEYGGWGGRYMLRTPAYKEFESKEKYPIYCPSPDEVIGIDGRIHRSHQATIWRWREQIQNDFISRLEWSIEPNFDECNHPPLIVIDNPIVKAKPGEKVKLNYRVSQPNGFPCSITSFSYPEAGTYGKDVPCVTTKGSTIVDVPMEAKGKTVHIVICAVSAYKTPIARYGRFIIEVE